MNEIIMNTSTIDDLLEIESKIIEQYRNDFYNQLLKDEEIKKTYVKFLKLMKMLYKMCL